MSLLDVTPDPKDPEGSHTSASVTSSARPSVRPALATRRDADGALEDGVWMGRALALVRLAGDDVEGAVLVRDHRFLGETASRERPERGVLRGRIGRDATLYLTHAPRDFARLASIRESGVRRVVVCDAPSSAMLHEAKRSGITLDVLHDLAALCA